MSSASYKKVIDIDQVKQVLALWANAVINPSGIPATPNIIFDFEIVPKLLKPFVTIRLSGPTQPGINDDIRWDGIPDTDNEGEFITDNEGNFIIENPDLWLEGVRVFRVEVQCFSDTEDAVMMATALQASFQQPQFSDILDAGGWQLTPQSAFDIAVDEVMDVVDLSEKIDSFKFERRAMLEFTLNVSFMAEFGTGSGEIDTVELGGNMGNIAENVDAVNTTE